MTSTRKLGKYEILTELGRGGFATVYQARDTHLGREVALKVIHGSHNHDPIFVECFQQEARTAAGLHHPRLITIYDFGESEGQLRHINGPNLAQLLAERGRFSLTEALPLLVQLAEAVDYLHEHRLVHRDLKPANILLEGSSPGWKVTLTDFGLVRSLSSSQVLSQSSAIVGTPAYLAPEQIDPKRWGMVTSLTDVYALGILGFFRVLCDKAT
jgi:eukaryotic-like serine/threonine-protein kinase